MSKRRMLNQDYYKMDAKTMIRSVPQNESKQTFKIMEIKAKRNWTPG